MKDRIQIILSNTSSRLILAIIVSGLFALASIAVWQVDAQRSEHLVDLTAPASKTDRMRARIVADREESADRTDLASVPRTTPEAGTIIYAYDYFSNSLVSFDASAPGILLTNVEITGINIENDDAIVGIDFRPVDGQLYGVVNNFPGRVRVVKINTFTGAATPVHPSNTIASLADSFHGVDFDPGSDRIRHVGRDRANRRISPVDGTVTNHDSQLTYAAGDPNAGVIPRIVHTAQTMTSGSSVSTLYGVDSEANTLVRIGGVNGDPSPSNGTVTTIGPLGVNCTNFGGMDIPPGSSFAYASLNIASIPTLFQIDLATGAATLIGEIGSGDRVIDGLSLPLGPLVQPTPSPTPTGTPSPTPTGMPSPTPTATATPRMTPTPVPSVTPTPIPDNASIVRAVNVLAQPGVPVSVPFDLIARGGEKRLKFSFAFHPTVLTDPVVTPVAGNSLIVDMSQVGNGRIGIDLDASSPLPAGTRRLLLVTFNVRPDAPVGTYPISYVNSPIPFEIRDGNGALLPWWFEQGNVVNGATAADVEVSGRVLTPDRRGLRNATVSMTGIDGTKRTVTTSSFGYYRFENAEAGGTYVISVESKRYRFSPRAIHVADALTDVNFVAN